MGQKTNPTVLRLEKTNQHFKACWYGHYYYSDQLHNNFKIRDYICKIFQKINRCQPLIYIKNSHQSNQILCFFLKKRMRRYKRFKFKKYSAQQNLTRNKLVISKKWSTFYGAALKKAQENLHNHSGTLIKKPVTSLSLPKHFAEYSGLPGYFRSEQSLDTLVRRGEPLGAPETTDLHSPEKDQESITPSRNTHVFPKLSTLLLSVFHKQSFQLLGRGENRELQIKHRTRMENTINLSNFHTYSLKNTPKFAGTLDDLETSGKKTHLYPILVSKITQNSDFIAQKIIGDLKKRVAYNRLRRQILRDVAKSKYVKGIRVTLSGRVKSQSKKAQKARTNTFHWGQTELHVFSSLVQFTSSHCITPFGKIGVKVWVCYHS